VNRLQATLLALCLWPTLALAQDQGMGLDLTGEDANKPEEQQSDPVETTPTEPSPPPSTEPVIPEPEPDTSLGADITQEDRVKSVQRKVYLKKGRFELTPLVSVSVADPYYSKLGASVHGAYYLADTLSVALRLSALQVLRSDDVRTAKRTFSANIYFSVPQWSAMADVEWSPLYGKVAFLNSILHFDGYLVAGLGAVKTETPDLPGRSPIKPGADLGAGMRFVAKDFLAVNVALINTSYVDQPLGTTKGALQNMMMLNAGISLFFPLSSTGREAE
jgi:outer membrane beta-barrel protein